MAAKKKPAAKPTAKPGAKGDSPKPKGKFADRYLEDSFKAGPKTSPDKQLVNLGLDWPSADLGRTPRPRRPLPGGPPNWDGLRPEPTPRASVDRGVNQGYNPFMGKPDPDPKINRRAAPPGSQGDGVRLKKPVAKKKR